MKFKDKLVASSQKSIISPYLAIVGVYMLCLVLLKVAEYFFLDIAAAGGSKVWVNAIVYNLIVASWVALGAGLLYCLVRLLSQKTALWLTALLYAVLLTAEAGLTLYVSHNGFLLGCELVARPLGETLMAVKGAMGVVLPVVLVVALMVGFVALALWRARRPSCGIWLVLVVGVLMILLSLIFKMSHLMNENYSYYIANKTHYLVADSFNYLKSAKSSQTAQIEFDEAALAELHATHPEWGNPIDPHYPLERTTPNGTFIAPYFGLPTTDAGTQAPNIVIILVESLGAEFMGSGAMPFVDSLAATGLYWPNCISATTRSYGAIPAITGSVGGPKSFQFGIMPDHNSLFSLLKEAGYNTRAYYAGDFNFDCVYEYLTAQGTDYLSPLYEEFTASPTRDPKNWWGYPDDTLFDYTIRDLTTYSRHAEAPHISLITTLTMHEELYLSDAAKQREYEQRAARLPRPQAGDRLASLYPAAILTDDALRSFLHDYRQLPGYENTLFVITGDHSSGRQPNDKLAFHHVPLILWSPLIQRPATFRHTVTHNDIAPAIYRLLTTRYGVPAQSTVHWLGDDLGPTPKTLLVVNYVHSIHDIIYHNYYYQSKDGIIPEMLYVIGPDFKLRPCDEPAALEYCRRQLELMRYLYSYTYHTNHLTAHPVAAREYTTVSRNNLPSDVIYAIPDPIPEGMAPCECVILPTTQLRKCEGYRTVRVTINADVTIEGNLSMDQHPDLIFSHWGNHYQQYSDLICKSLSDDNRLNISKEFALSTDNPNSLQVVLKAPGSDKNWLPGSSVTLSNTQILIEYGK